MRINLRPRLTGKVNYQTSQGTGLPVLGGTPEVFNPYHDRFLKGLSKATT